MPLVTVLAVAVAVSVSAVDAAGTCALFNFLAAGDLSGVLADTEGVAAVVIGLFCGWKKLRISFIFTRRHIKKNNPNIYSLYSFALKILPLESNNF